MNPFFGVMGGGGRPHVQQQAQQMSGMFDGMRGMFGK